MTPPKSNKRFFTPSNFGFFIEIFCKVSASREKNRASREKNEACFDFSEAQPVLSKKQNQACLKFRFFRGAAGFIKKAKSSLCLSGTALRCMLRWLLCPGRSPGLTESASALRTSPRSLDAERDSFGVVASPKRLSRVATGDPMRHRCAPTNGVAMKYRVRVADIPLALRNEGRE